MIVMGVGGDGCDGGLMNQDMGLSSTWDGIDRHRRSIVGCLEDNYVWNDTVGEWCDIMAHNEIHHGQNCGGDLFQLLASETDFDKFTKRGLLKFVLKQSVLSCSPP
jgi:hypothetical protein